jgi:PBP4 family serine-type D-alanyl-D-alanine carboxypeptidase
MISHLRFIVMVWILFSPPAFLSTQSGPTLTGRIQAVMDRPEFKHAHFGIEFYSLDENKPIYSLNEEKLFTPGSTTKLVTEGTALRLLGRDFRFHTKVFRTGPIDRKGVLKGDLVLVAGGDPNLSGRIRSDNTLTFQNTDHSYDGSPSTRAVEGDPLAVIRDLARKVAAQGIKRIRGRVLIDATLFPEGDRELGTDVVISPIVVNDNLVDVMVGPGMSPNSPVTLTPAPETAYVRFLNHATTGDSGSEPDIHWSDDITLPDGTHNVTVEGAFPAGGPPILYAYNVPEPSRFAQTVFAEALAGLGIRIDGRGPSAATPDFKALAANYTPEALVAEHISSPFSEEVKVTLKVSQNLHASMVPYMLPAILAPDDSDKTGFDLMRECLTGMGLDLGGASQADGAGGDALFSPSFMVNFLARFAALPDSSLFRNALPVLGRDGTLENIQSESPAAGHVAAKTGTFATADPMNNGIMLGAKGLAGYITTRDGRRLAFAVYVNNVACSTGEDIKRVGQALGEIAAAAYDSLP